MKEALLVVALLFIAVITLVVVEVGVLSQSYSPVQVEQHKQSQDRHFWEFQLGPQDC